ncbi:hypothetical protein [Streptomyces sp. NPDC058424]|uniref:hypothetical protein n=1 Tax=Streptomyces sp. NPDC058424 TaxID=3346491 RepID=UPI003666273C
MDRKTGRISIKTVYAVTSLTAEQAPPADLAETTIRRLLGRIDGDALDQAVSQTELPRGPPDADGRRGTSAR